MKAASTPNKTIIYLRGIFAGKFLLNGTQSTLITSYFFLLFTYPFIYLLVVNMWIFKKAQFRER